MATFESSAEFAATMDARDPLRTYRARFHVPQDASGEDVVYFCGHSLGLQPRTLRAYVEQELADWAALGVEGHFRAQNPWLGYHRLLRDQAAAIVGAQADEVVVMNSLTVNLHLMMVSFYRPEKQRHKILVERGAFPSDQYAVKSQIRFHGFDPGEALVELTPRAGEFTLRTEDIVATIEREGPSIALVLLGGINYSTGQAFDMEAIARAAHCQGCAVGFDLAHAAGNILLRMHDWDADFAVWCSYKYLNGGPGCVGGCFVHQRHAREASLPRFAGWWGNEEQTRFQMGPDFQAAPGADGWQLSNAPIFSMAALRASLDIFAEAGMAALRAKSESLTGYLEFLLDCRRSPRYFLLTPHDPAQRGAQLSIRVSGDGRGLCERLAAQGVLCDFREPDIIRAAPVPLYNSYKDVWRFVERFAEAVA